jgi:hypothetical protein
MRSVEETEARRHDADDFVSRAIDRQQVGRTDVDLGRTCVSRERD